MPSHHFSPPPVEPVPSLNIHDVHTTGHHDLQGKNCLPNPVPGERDCSVFVFHIFNAFYLKVVFLLICSSDSVTEHV